MSSGYSLKSPKLSSFFDADFLLSLSEFSLFSSDLLLDSLDQYCRGGIMLSLIHNRDLDYQPYGNANGTADELELSNGIDCVNHMHFQPNPGFDFTQDVNGNHIVRPNAVYAGHLEKKCD